MPERISVILKKGIGAVVCRSAGVFGAFAMDRVVVLGLFDEEGANLMRRASDWAAQPSDNELKSRAGAIGVQFGMLSCVVAVAPRSCRS